MQRRAVRAGVPEKKKPGLSIETGLSTVVVITSGHIANEDEKEGYLRQLLYHAFSR